MSPMFWEAPLNPLHVSLIKVEAESCRGGKQVVTCSGCANPRICNWADMACGCYVARPSGGPRATGRTGRRAGDAVARGDNLVQPSSGSEAYVCVMDGAPGVATLLQPRSTGLCARR